ncbi:MAG: flagellar hook-associated protein FlgK [Janthinobacterium lividum]
MATQSLLAQELELQVTNNNIANANTAGYTRETVNLAESDPVQEGSLSIGTGVTVDGVQSLSDTLLTMRIQQQTSDESKATAQVNALNEVQTLFPSSGTSVSTAMSAFFTSLSALSTDPSNSADRQTVMSDAQTLVQQFNSVSEGLTGTASILNTTVQTDVTQINQLSSQAANLNQQLVEQTPAGQSTGTISDQLNEVESQLASLTNISVIHTAQGDSITTGTGTALVLGNQSYALQTTTGSDGNTAVLDSNGTDITSTISSGDLGGSLLVRDSQIPSLLNSLDTLANQFSTAFNAAQAEGYDENGDAGTALFSVSSTVAGSAASLFLVTTSGSAIAASSVPGSASSGDDGNLDNLTALQNSPLASGQSATTMSSNLTYQIGTLTASAMAEQSALQTSLTALNNQQGSVSGVSIDEESANLLRFQEAYQAAAKVVSTIQTLFDTTINMIN